MRTRRSATYAGAVTAPARSRDFCARALHSLLEPSDGLDDLVASAQVIVSELVTNAVNACCDHAEVAIACDHACDGPAELRVRIEVSDDGNGTPAVQRPATTDTHGRGLQIVAALSSAWGVEADGRGTRVWAELAVA